MGGLSRGKARAAGQDSSPDAMAALMDPREVRRHEGCLDDREWRGKIAV